MDIAFFRICDGISTKKTVQGKINKKTNKRLRQRRSTHSIDQQKRFFFYSDDVLMYYRNSKKKHFFGCWYLCMRDMGEERKTILKALPKNSTAD